MSEFQVQASIDVVIDNSEIRDAARELEKRFAATLKPITLKIANDQSAVFNRNLVSITTSLNTVQRQAVSTERAFRTLGRVGADAFRSVGVAKDRLRANIRLLERDLVRTTAAARTAGTSASTAFSNLPPVTVSVIPVFLPATLGTLPPITVPVIPVLAPVTFQPLAVPVVPIFPQLKELETTITARVIAEPDRASFEQVVNLPELHNLEILMPVVLDLERLKGDFVTLGRLIDEFQANNKVRVQAEGDFFGGGTKPAITLKEITSAAQTALPPVDALGAAALGTFRQFDQGILTIDNFGRSIVDLRNIVQDFGDGFGPGTAALAEFTRRLPKASELVQNLRFHIDKLLTRFKDERGSFELFGIGKKSKEATEILQRFAVGARLTSDELEKLGSVGEASLAILARKAGVSGKRLQDLHKLFLNARQEAERLAAAEAKRANSDALKAQAQEAARAQQTAQQAAKEQAAEAARLAQEELQQTQALAAAKAQAAQAEKQASREIRRASKAERDAEAREAQAAIDRATEAEAAGLRKQEALRVKATKDLNNQLNQSQTGAGGFQFKFTGLDDALRKLGLLKDASNKLGTDESFDRFAASLQKAAPQLGLTTERLENLVDLTRRFGHFVPPGGFEIVSERNRGAAEAIVKDFSRLTTDAKEFEAGIRALNRTFGISIKQLETFAGRSIKAGGSGIGDRLSSEVGAIRFDGLLNVLEKVRQKIVGLFKGFGNNVGKQLVPVENRLVQTSNSVKTAQDKMKRSTDEAARSFNNAATGAGGFGSALRRLITIAGTYLSVTKFVQGVDLAADWDAQKQALFGLIAATEGEAGAQAKANQVFADAIELSKRTGIEVGTITKAYQKLISQGASPSEAAAQIELFARAVLASGGGTEEFNRALTAFTQIVGKGTLSMEELRQQLFEAIPSAQTKFFENLAVAIEDAGLASGVTAQEARDMTADGLVPSNVAATALFKTLNEVPGAMDAINNRASSLRGILDSLKVGLQVIVVDALEPFAKALKNGADQITAFNEQGQLITGTEALAELIGQVLRPAFEAIVPLIQGLGAAFLELQPTLVRFAELFRDMAPDLAVVGVAAAKIVGVIANLTANFLEFLQRNRALVPILTTLLALFVQFKVVVGVATAITKLTTAFKTFGAATAFLSTQIKGATTALAAFRVGSLSALTVLGGFGVALAAGAAAWYAFGNASKTNAQIVSEASEIIRQSLTPFEGGVTALLGTGDIKFSGIEDLNQFINAALEKGDDASDAKIRAAFLQRLGEIYRVDPATARQIIKDSQLAGLDPRILKPLEDELARLEGLRSDRDKDLVGQTGTVTGPAADAEKELTDKYKEQISAIEGVIGAQQRLKNARDRVADLGEQITELERERNRLVNNTWIREDEIADAKDRQRQIQRDINDLIQQQNDAAEDERIRQREYEQFVADIPNKRLSAQLALQRALLDEKRAKEDLKALEEERTEGQTPFLNLAGLTLDQARSQLANARASLRAQEAAKKNQTDELDKARAIEDAAINVQEAGINVQDAKNAQRDLEEEIVEQSRQNNIAQREYGELVGDLAVQLASLHRDRVEAADELARLQRGETGVLKTIKDLNKQIKDLMEQRVDAQNELTNAQHDYNIAVAKLRGDEEAIVKAEQAKLTALAGQAGFTKEIRDLVLEKIGLLDEEYAKQKRNNEEASKPITQTKTTVNETVNRSPVNQNPPSVSDLASGQGAIPGVGTPTGGLFGGTDLASILGTAGTALISAAARLEEIEKRIQRLDREAGFTSVRAFAEGGFIPGKNDNIGITARIGERGSEAVLPLYSKIHMERVLRDNRILNPVLAALPKVTISDGAGRFEPKFNSPVPSFEPTGRSSVALIEKTSTKPSPAAQSAAKAEARKERQALANEIGTVVAREIVSALEGREDATVNINQNISHPDPAITARLAARAAKQEWRKRNQ